MVTDQQVRRLFKLIQTERDFGIAAMKAGMDEKTARKYRKQGKLANELKGESYCQMLCMTLGGDPIFFYSIGSIRNFLTEIIR